MSVLPNPRTARRSSRRCWNTARPSVRSDRTVLEAPSERHFASVDAGLAGYKARHNLALVYEDLGQTDLAKQEWRAILKERPGYLPAIAALRQPG